MCGKADSNSSRSSGLLSLTRRSDEVPFAELLQTLEVLAPSRDETRCAIAASLGFAWQTQGRTDTGKREFFVHQASADDAQKEEVDDIDVIPDHYDRLADAHTDANEHERGGVDDFFLRWSTVESQITILEPVGRALAPIEMAVLRMLEAPVDALKPTDVALHMGRPPFFPLFREEWVRGVICGLVATPSESRDIDWRLLEGQLLKLVPLTRLPFRRRPSMRQGVQLLLDRSESMQPYWRDMEELIKQVERLLGSNSVKTYFFEFDPLSTPESQFKWPDGQQPELIPATPLMIVSDFGMARAGLAQRQVTLSGWQHLLHQAAGQRCDILALIPQDEHLWPDSVRDLIPGSVVWDQQTSAQTVRRNRPRIR